MLPHQQRVVDEKSELDEKLAKLSGFFSNPIFAGLAPEEQCRLKSQAYHMSEYSRILGQRIENF